MKGEVDKNQNIHALKVGHQIMLCKKERFAEENEIVFLWPSTVICEIAKQYAKKSAKKSQHIEECTYNKEIYQSHPCKNMHPIFLLSVDGARYSKDQKITRIWKENQKESRHFATIEYRYIKPYFLMELQIRNCLSS